MNTRKALQGLLGAAVLMAGLASCNSVATGTRTISGTITAMGLNRSSITVAGQTLKVISVPAQNQSASRISVNGSSATERALSVGQRVDTKVTSNNEATDINVRLELKGSVNSIDLAGNKLVVAGLTVNVTSATRFDIEGPGDDEKTASTHTLSDLKVGDFVEVTGSTDTATGQITATKIEVKTGEELGEDGEDHETELKGTVSGLNGTSFKLGEATVNCTGTCTLPTGLKNGDFVEAEGAFDEATKTLTATKVKLEDNDHHEGEHSGSGSGNSGSGEGGHGGEGGHDDGSGHD